METSWERRSNGPLLALSLRKEKVTDSRQWAETE